MREPDPTLLQETTRRLVAELGERPAMAAEQARARREFAGGGPHLNGPAAAAAEGRFCEWFVIERESEILGDVPARVAPGIADPVRSALLDSVCSLFVVESASDETRVSDVVTGDDFTLAGDVGLQRGAVLVGRLYPAQGETMAPSPLAAVVVDGTELVAAVRRDLGRAGLDRRLTQAELEVILFRNPHTALAAEEPEHLPPEHLEARLQQQLAEGGADDIDPAAVSAALAAAGSPGPVIGPLLEKLAFDTAADLDAVQRTLLELWNAHRARAGPPAAAREPRRRARAAGDDTAAGLGAAIVRRIDEGLAAQQDLESLFADVENMVGGPADEEDEEDESPGGGPEGDLEPLIAEFLWERGYGPDSAPAAVLGALLVQQRGLPVPGVYLEAIPARDFARLLLQVYLGSPPTQRGARTQAHFEVLREFVDWAVETQEYDLQPALAACERDMAAPLARTDRASLALSTGAAGGRNPALHRVLRVEAGEVEVVSDRSPNAWLDVPEAASLVRPGDMLLATLREAPAGRVRVEGLAVLLPAAAAELIE